MARRSQRDKELTPIRPRSAIRHAHHSFPIMSQLWRKLIFEFLAPHGFSTGAVKVRVVSSLDHETFDDAVERHVVVFSLLGECAEVLDSL